MSGIGVESGHCIAIDGRVMSESRETIRLRSELGREKWEAIGHFLIDGDYLGFNEGNFQGAIEKYEEAWKLLSTPWQQRVGGSDILRGMVDFALQARDPSLASKVHQCVVPRLAMIGDASLESESEKLAKFANDRM